MYFANSKETKATLSSLISYLNQEIINTQFPSRLSTHEKEQETISIITIIFVIIPISKHQTSDLV